MATLHTDTKLIDLAARLPFAFASDFFTGPAWQYVIWPSIPKYEGNGSLILSEISINIGEGNNFFGSAAVAAGSQCLLAAGAFVCWMVLKFCPSTQMILLAVWMEAVAMFVITVGLSLASLYTTISISFVLTVFLTILHSLMLANLRQLRLLEMMGLPPSILEQTRLTSNIGELVPTYLWPHIPLLITLYRTCNELDDQTRAVLAGLITVTSLPTIWLICDGMRWRIVGLRYALHARSSGEFRLSVVSPYYFTIDAFYWPSANEHLVNNAYAIVFLTRVIHGLTTAFMRDPSPSKIFSQIATSVLQATTASWVSNFGGCWLLASLAHQGLATWYRLIGVTFTPQEEREHALVPYDMSGLFLALCFMGNIMAPDLALTGEHLIRLVAFFGLAKLAEIPLQAGLAAQRAAMDGVGNFRTYSRSIVDGSIMPVGIGYLLLQRMWKAPIVVEQFFSLTWLTDRTNLFFSEYEIWMHGKAVLYSIDLAVAGSAAIMSTIASQAHLVSHQSPRVWHAVLQKTDCLQKLWTLFIREFLSVLLHTAVLALLWDSQWDGFLVTAIYMSRLMGSLEELHSVSTEGLGATFFCWSRCVIRALPSPDEEELIEWNDKCSICQLEEPDRLRICVFPCSHFFHRECIEEWLKQRMCCPLCMRRIWFENGEVMIDK